MKMTADHQRLITAKSRKTAGSGRRTVDVICAFCRGTGRDPFGVMSPLATCQVCGGTGQRALHRPTAPCAFCRGTGVHPASRNTCTTCGGVGVVEVPAHTVPCPSCAGSGRAADHAWPNSPLSCSRCGGKGIVALELAAKIINRRDR